MFSHALSIGRSGVLLEAPSSAPLSAGCALVPTAGSGSNWQLGFTSRPVLVEPAVAPVNNSQYYAADRTWKSIPEVTSGSIQSALGYLPANDSQVVKLTGDQTVGGTKNFSGYLQVGYAGFNQGNTDIYKFGNNAQFAQYNSASQLHNLLRTDAANLLGATTFSGPVNLSSRDITSTGTGGVRIIGDPVTGTFPLTILSGPSTILQVGFTGSLSLATDAVVNVGAGLAHFSKIGASAGISGWNDIILRPGALQSGTTQAVRVQYGNGADAPITAGTGTFNGPVNGLTISRINSERVAIGSELNPTVQTFIGNSASFTGNVVIDNQVTSTNELQFLGNGSVPPFALRSIGGSFLQVSSPYAVENWRFGTSRVSGGPVEIDWSNLNAPYLGFAPYGGSSDVRFQRHTSETAGVRANGGLVVTNLTGSSVAPVTASVFTSTTNVVLQTPDAGTGIYSLSDQGMYVANRANTYTYARISGNEVSGNITGRIRLGDSSAGMYATGGGNIVIDGGNSDTSVFITPGGMHMWANRRLTWANTNNVGGLIQSSTASLGITQASLGVLEINNGTTGILRDLSARAGTFNGNVTISNGFALTTPNSDAQLVLFNGAVQAWSANGLIIGNGGPRLVNSSGTLNIQNGATVVASVSPTGAATFSGNLTVGNTLYVNNAQQRVGIGVASGSALTIGGDRILTFSGGSGFLDNVGQITSSGALMIASSNVRLGGDVSGGRLNVIGTADTAIPVAIQQGSGGASQLVTIRDSSGVERIAMHSTGAATFSGNVQAGSGRLFFWGGNGNSACLTSTPIDATCGDLNTSGTTAVSLVAAGNGTALRQLRASSISIGNDWNVAKTASINFDGSITASNATLSGNVNIGATAVASRLFTLTSSSSALTMAMSAGGSERAYLGLGTGVISSGAVTEFGIGADAIVLCSLTGGPRVRVDSTGLSAGAATFTGNVQLSGSTAFGSNSIRNLSVASDGLATLRFDDNGYRAGLTFQNSGITAGGQGIGLAWRMGRTAVDTGEVAAIRVVAENDYTTGGRLTRIAFMTQGSTYAEKMSLSHAGDLIVSRDIYQGFGSMNFSARFRMIAAGQRVAEVYDSGLAVWQSGDREEASSSGLKRGFFNATPIIQVTTGITGATHVAGVGTGVKVDDTFGGYTIGQAIAALRAYGLLA